MRYYVRVMIFRLGWICEWTAILTLLDILVIISV